MKKTILATALILVLLGSACTTVAPVPPPGDTPAPTPTPPATETLMDTPAPTATIIGAPGDTPLPPASGQTMTPIQHSALNPVGPYLATLRSQGDQYEIVLTDANGIGQKVIPYPANASILGAPLSLSDTLSPDGKWLAYFTGSAGACFGNGMADSADLTLNLLNLANGQSQVVTKLLSQDYPKNFAQAAGQIGISAELLQNAFVCGITQSIAWSPNGRYLAFAGQMDNLSSDLYLYDLARGSIQRLSSGPEEVQRIAWSPDGQWILDWSSFESGEGMTYNAYATSLDGKTINSLYSNTCGGLGWLYATTYYFSDCGNGVGRTNLSLVDIATAKVTKIWAGEFSSLALSADHQSIAFVSLFSQKFLQAGSDPGFTPGIYLINLATLEQTLVKVPDSSHTYASIQSLGSGQRTFAVLDASDNDLHFVASNGVLSSAIAKASRLSVSPDRQTLLILDQKIRLLKADGSPIRDVDLPAGVTQQGIWTFIWRPDSSGLFFTYADLKVYSAATQLYELDLLQGAPVLVDYLSPEGLGDFVWVGVPK
jgi:WD40 repeat protein